MDDPPCSSSSSSSLPRPRDVFLNFRGEDIRNNFVCHLHSALKRALVNVYLDDEELKEGDSLSKLFKAIEESKISVVVFSENYATSKWCLNELVKIMDCNVNQKQTVIPIFYRVDPSDVRKQTGSFGQAFDKHELSLGKDNDLVQSWRKALTEASNIVGWHFTKNENDAKLIDEIVESVFNMLLRMSSTSKESDLVGMESCIKKMELGTPLQMDKVRRIGISGMGGIGKTTIATAVYDQYRSSFDKVCFVHDVKEKFPKGGVNLLKEILSRLSKIREVCINTLGEGYSRMKKLSNTTVLVVLDDVDTRDQIDTLLDGPSFGGGSRIIVTTRHSDILSGFEEHKAELLSESDALTLFRQRAFKTNRPSKEFEHLSQRAVKYAEGLPLALKVIGSLLGDMTSALEWEQELNKMKDILNPDIHKALIISYRGLDDLAQKIFLDIACFFRGRALDYVTKVLDIHGFHPKPGIKTLVQRSLVTITESGNVEMHDLLQEMGRHVESGMKDGERRRFWSKDDVVDVLNRTTDTQNVEGLMMKLTNKEDRHFNAEALEHMRNLRLLLFTNWGRYYGDEGENHVNVLSHKLSVLVWHRCPLKCLPSTFDPKNLFQLDMRGSRIEHLWERDKRASNLTSIDLSDCPYLKHTPDLTGLPNLEKLYLSHCKSLTEVHPSVFAHKNLVFLSLASCRELRSLPSTIRMKSLKTLDLSFCVNLEMFPDVPEYMEALSKLKLFQTAIKELPSSIERLRGLESLDMTHCKNLIRLPDSICNLAKLRSLKLVECLELSKLPENIGNMETLLDLEVNRCGLEQFPVSILRLKVGGQLSFRGCKMAAPFSSWPSSIEDRCTDVVHLDFSGCNMIKLSDAIACFPSLKVLNLSSNNLESLPAAMKELGCLERLELNGCRRLISIPELSSSISYINAQDCTDLVSVITPQSPYHIGRCFNFSNCSKVQEDVFRDIAENHFPPQGNPSQLFYFSCPGSEIPEQFIHHNTGASVTAKLPPNWFNNKKSTGFAICAVANMPQGVKYYRLTAQCLCTFKGDHCKYSFSFCFFDAYFHTDHFDPTKFNGLESNHMLVGYVPWSELGMNGEQGNGRCYTEAKFEIELSLGRHPMYFAGRPHRNGICKPCIRSCGVRFFFGNNEEDFGEPMEQVDDSEWRASSSDWTSDTSDEDEQYRELSLVFRGANRPPNFLTIEDHEDTSGQREPLETWEQEVRITWGMMQGCLNDGYDWFRLTSRRKRCVYLCKHGPGCWAKAVVPTPNDPAILQITYVGRHTCWKNQPMLTYQVRVTPGMGIECPPDGDSWREYDQRDIPGSRYPRRSYYVCTPQNYGGCMAMKEVRCSEDQKILKITYRLRHTCTLPSPSVGGRAESSTRSVYDQIVQSPISPVDNPVDDDDVNLLPDANSPDMEHSHNTEDVANNDMNVSNEELSGLSLRSLKKLCKKRTREMREADDDQTK